VFTDSYERKLKGNSLILSEEGDYSDNNVFEERMITENSIKGFLPCTVRLLDDKKQFVYDITSKQNYCSLYEEKEMKANDIHKLISGLVSVRAEINEYLLNDGNLVLNPKFIYADPETKIPNFVFYPYYDMAINESLSELGLFILERTDHEDDEAVALAYGFYKYITKEDYAFERLLHKPVSSNISNSNDKYEIPKEVTESDTEEKSISEYEEVQALREENNKFEKVIMGISSVILIILIAMVIGLKFYNLERIIPISNGTIVGMICLIGALAISAPVGILINRIRSESLKQGYEIITENMADKSHVMKKNKTAENDSWGKTGEVSAKCFRRLVCYETDKIIEFCIRKTPYVIGKSKQDVDGYLDFPGASRIHTRIDKKGEDYVITDCNSTNGTSVNGRMLTVNESVKLHENDEVSIAGMVFYFR